jgi:hypothetical protein
MNFVWLVVGFVVIAGMALALRRWWDRGDAEDPEAKRGEGPFIPPMA